MKDVKEFLEEEGIDDLIVDVKNNKDIRISDLIKKYTDNKLKIYDVTVPHLVALIKEIEDNHSYGFDDVLSDYLKRNDL